MKVSEITYTGLLGTEAVHTPSGTLIRTDAPPDNQGLGQSFSPTDLTATALAACMFTIMGIKARDKGWDLQGMKAEVEKIMASDPRRISGIGIRIQMPPGDWPDSARTILQRAAATCPVALSLHPEIAVDLQWNWPAATIPAVHP